MTAVSTPQRILDAATAEFAQFGMAGARVDRIAERAGANKQRIYAYFGGKESLFDRVIEAHIGTLLDAVPFDADDLPGYAERLLVFNAEHPVFVRLLLWHGLERPGVLAGLEPSVASTQAKAEALAAAMHAHPERFAEGLRADRLLAQVLAVVHGLSLTVAMGSAALDDARGDARRIVELVAITARP